MCSPARKSHIKSFVTGEPINEFENTHAAAAEQRSHQRSFGNKIFIMKFDLMRGWGEDTPAKAGGRVRLAGCLCVLRAAIAFTRPFMKYGPAWPPVTPWGMHYAKNAEQMIISCRPQYVHRALWPADRPSALIWLSLAPPKLLLPTDGQHHASEFPCACAKQGPAGGPGRKYFTPRWLDGRVGGWVAARLNGCVSCADKSIWRYGHVLVCSFRV